MQKKSRCGQDYVKEKAADKMPAAQTVKKALSVSTSSRQHSGNCNSRASAPLQFRALPACIRHWRRQAPLALKGELVFARVRTLANTRPRPLGRGGTEGDGEGFGI